MKKLSMILLSLLIFGPLTVFGQASPSPGNGKNVYDKWCAHCHAEATAGLLPGTAGLQLKYKGSLPALLEERTDLAPEYIRMVVREGLISMPITRKTEVSDRELEDIVAYLTGSDAGD